MPAERSGIWGCRRPRAAAAAPRALGPLPGAACAGGARLSPPAAAARPAPTAPRAHPRRARPHLALPLGPGAPSPSRPPRGDPPAPQPPSLAFFSRNQSIKGTEMGTHCKVRAAEGERPAVFPSLTPPHLRLLPHSAPHPDPASTRPCLLLIMILISPSRFSTH